jgi:hypothetical protein
MADNFRNDEKQLTYSLLDSIMFHGGQCGSYGICLWFVSDALQLSALLAPCSVTVSE